MGSETIKIYIPIEKRQEQVVEEFIHTCLNNMDSVTVDTVKKYIKSNENKVVVNECTRIICYGRLQLYKDVIKQAALNLMIKLDLNYLYLEINDMEESLGENDIKFYVNRKC